MQNVKVTDRRRTALLAFCILQFAFCISAQANQFRQLLRAELLGMINKDRAEAGLNPVLLDPQASEIADRYCDTQVREKTIGHFSLDGVPPYARYSLAGGYDGVTENAAAWSANYKLSEPMIASFVRQSHWAMMLEAPPRDGHRRAILDPSATHVGIGFAWERGELRIAEEFVRRYVHFLDPVPRRASSTARLILRGRPLPSHGVDAISVYFEPIPRPVGRKAASSIESYGLPQRRRDYLPRLGTSSFKDGDGRSITRTEEYAGGGKGDFPVAKDGLFEFPIPFRDGQGLYTIVVWLRKPGVQNPINASTISIVVN